MNDQIAQPEPGPTTAAQEGYESDGQIACRMAMHIAKLRPGAAAELRRGPLRSNGRYAFWRVLARYRPNRATERVEAWAALVQAIAVLTPRGHAQPKPAAHDPRRPLGAALADAKLSEARLSQLLSTNGARQRHLALGACRRIAKATRSRVDVRTLCALILEGGEEVGDQIGAEYWRAVERGRKTETKTEEGETT